MYNDNEQRQYEDASMQLQFEQEKEDFYKNHVGEDEYYMKYMSVEDYNYYCNKK